MCLGNMSHVDDGAGPIDGYLRHTRRNAAPERHDTTMLCSFPLPRPNRKDIAKFRARVRLWQGLRNRGHVIRSGDETYFQSVKQRHTAR
jgi:hypothetical protein